MTRMLEEIREQPEALERTLAAELPRVEKLKSLLERHRPRLVVLAARGTSDNAAFFGRYLLEITTGIPVSLAAPSAFTLYNAHIDYRDTLVVGISQSGESTDINVVMERARECGALTLGITNERSSTLARIASQTLFVHAGKERSVAATKTYTGQVLTLYLLAYALGGHIRMGRLRRIPDHAAMALRLESEVTELAERYRFMTRAVVLGRGLNYGTAFEFSLKLMETCYVMAERFSAADFLHGPIAVVDRSVPVFIFCPAGATWPAMQEMLAKVKNSNGEAVVISDAGNPEALAAGSRVIRLPRKLDERVTPIPYIIPAQIFAASLAVQKGLNPDQPRTLSKVTKTM